MERGAQGLKLLVSNAGTENEIKDRRRVTQGDGISQGLGNIRLRVVERRISIATGDNRFTISPLPALS